MNLLYEIEVGLKHHGKTLKDIKWAGTTEFRIPLDNFLTLADTNYDNGFGGTEIAGDLLVVGEDWWLERHEYDGSEWWEFKQIPKRPPRIREVKALSRKQATKAGVDWYEDTLEGLNMEEE
jgi:hypothetical protein